LMVFQRRAEEIIPKDPIITGLVSEFWTGTQRRFIKKGPNKGGLFNSLPK